jgi:hypothetical protein
MGTVYQFPVVFDPPERGARAMLHTLQHPDGCNAVPRSSIFLIDGSRRGINRVGMVVNVPDDCLPHLLSRGWVLRGEAYERHLSESCWRRLGVAKGQCKCC